MNKELKNMVNMTDMVEHLQKAQEECYKAFECSHTPKNEDDPMWAYDGSLEQEKFDNNDLEYQKALLGAVARSTSWLIEVILNNNIRQLPHFGRLIDLIRQMDNIYELKQALKAVDEVSCQRQ